MRPDIRGRLKDAALQPSHDADVEDIRRRSRRRYIRDRITALTVSTVALLAVIGLVGTNVNDSRSRAPAIDPVAPNGTGSMTQEDDPNSGRTRPSDLLGRTFVSVDVQSEASELSPVSDRQIFVTFIEAGPTEWHISWWGTGCGAVSAPVDIDADSLDVGRTAQQAIACHPLPDEDVALTEVEERDAWVREFFESNPRWVLEGQQLTLTSGSTLIQFEERPQG